jgi:putative acetyltransferase
MNEMITIRPFQANDQEAAKAVIMDGLEEHWGFLDLALNPDLNHIHKTYASGTFLVAEMGGTIVGTGALIPEGDRCSRIVRMSVAASQRRLGIGCLLLNALCATAYAAGCREIVLETTTTWHDAIAFYLNYGFEIVAEQDGDFHFVLPLLTEKPA